MKGNHAEAYRAGFVLGVVHAAWFLHRMHGDDQNAEELLLELGPSIDTLRRLARKEEYCFKRGFWQWLERRRDSRNPVAERTPGEGK